MYNTRNKAVAAFIYYNFGKEAFDHVEMFSGSVFFYFNINRNEQDLLDFIQAFSSIGKIINELKPYESNPSI